MYIHNLPLALSKGVWRLQMVIAHPHHVRVWWRDSRSMQYKTIGMPMWVGVPRKVHRKFEEEPLAKSGIQYL